MATPPTLPPFPGIRAFLLGCSLLLLTPAASWPAPASRIPSVAVNRPSPRPLVLRQPEQVRGWIILDHDIPETRNLVELAAQRDINHLQLSHGWIEGVDDIVNNGQRAAEIQDICQRAQTHGIETYVWSSEINVSDGLNFCFDAGSGDINQRKQAMREALDRVPELAGIVISFGSSNLEPWAAVSSCGGEGTGDHVYRVRRLLEEFHSVIVGEKQRKMIVRTFIHFPSELEWLTEAIRQLDALDFMVMTKPEPNDFMPLYPLSPDFGGVGNHPQFIEFDLTGEYWGQAAIPCDLTGFIATRMRQAMAKGATAGAAGRIQRGSRYARDTPNEINMAAMSAFLADPAADPLQVRRDWLASRYALTPGDPRLAILEGIYGRTYDIIRNVYYVKSDWVYTKGSEFPEDIFEPVAWLARTTAKWDSEAVPLFFELLNPSDQTLREMMQEKREAVVLAEECLDSLATLGSLPRRADLDDLTRRLTKLHYTALTWEALTKVTYGHRAWFNGFAPRHAALTRAGLMDLDILAFEIDRHVPGDKFPLDTETLRGYIDSVKAFFWDPQPPRDYDFIGLDEIRVEVLSATDARVTFASDRPAKGSVTFWTGSRLVAQSRSELTESTSHSLTLTGLQPGTWYHFTAGAEDAERHTITSSAYTFWTQ